MRSRTTTPTRYINFYFQVHQPRRLRRYQFFDIGSGISYFDESLNREIVERVAAECYLPANDMLLRLIKRHPDVRITFSLSGTVLEQLETVAPAALASFRRLAHTGSVEFLCETYYHSLASFLDEAEFAAQVEAHRLAIMKHFGQSPRVFRNTELLYSDEIGRRVHELGFDGMYLDGIGQILQGRPANALYVHPQVPLRLFTRNYRLSDDVAFRYSDPSWSEWPLTPDTFLRWLRETPLRGDVLCLGMDYETLGEHQKGCGGIFAFMESLLTGVSADTGLTFANPSEILKAVSPSDILAVGRAVSWADHERDASAWLGNDMQRDAFECLRRLCRQARQTGDEHLLNDCRYLQTSDHFYYMSTKKGSDGEVHRYFSPYASPYEAYMNYMNVLADMEYRFTQLRNTRVVRPEVVLA